MRDIDAYPVDLAALVRRQWNKPLTLQRWVVPPADEKSDELPSPAMLLRVLSTCYQASLSRDEGRAVRFRAILAEPRGSAMSRGAPGRHHVLTFARPVRFTANDLRRLAPAAAFERALIGVRVRKGSLLEVWGMVHSGEQWLRALEGSGRPFLPLPSCLVVNVNNPAQITVSKGSVALARLHAGRLSTPAPSFLEVNLEEAEDQAMSTAILAKLERERRRRRSTFAQLSSGLIIQVFRQTALRVLSAMRGLQHGGTLLLLPTALARSPKRWQPFLQIKYALSPGPARRRLFVLLLDLLEALARECGHRYGPKHEVTWQDYLASVDREVRGADEAISDLVRLLASMSSVDGALALARPLEILGFGAEISGRLKPVEYVARMLDALGTRIALESAWEVGTRHRSAYRFCQAFPGVIASVVSQDGSIRIMRLVGDRVVYSDHFATGMLDS